MPCGHYCSADLEPVVEELKQAVVKLNELLGYMKSQLLGTTSAIAREQIGQVPSASQLATPAALSFPSSKTTVSAATQHSAAFEWDKEVSGQADVTRLESGFEAQSLPDFDLPTTSQMPLRSALACITFTWSLANSLQ